MVSTTFRRPHHPPQDTVHLERKVILHTAYLSPEIAKLKEEIENTYALGEDIFYNIRPFYSNFSEAYGVFGLYNRSEEHTSELQSRGHLVCRLLLEKKKIEIDILRDI